MINVELLYDDEEFRRIYYNGIETNYMISNYGRVWSDNRNIIMKNGTDRNGRANIHLLVNGKNWIPNISRLLGLTFLCSITPMISNGNIITNNGFGLIQFIYLYFIGAYIRLLTTKYKFKNKARFQYQSFCE